MKTLRGPELLWILASCALPVVVRAATLTDSFNTNVNYLTNGVAGTIWDGVYFGAGEFANTGLGGGGPGATLQCDANLTAPNKLTLQTTGTAWENADDDGFFLFQVVRGDFSAIMHVVSPFNNAAYNTAGLQARAFSAGGNPFNGSENFVSWTRFDEFSFANYLRNEVNGGVAQINPGNYPNTNYWLRMDRVNGTNFSFYERATSNGSWQLISFPAPVSGTTLKRADFAGQALQVGIIHATFNGLLGVQFSDFSITATNFDGLATTPGAAAGLTLTTNSAGLNVAWTPGRGSAGSLVAVWTGTNNIVKEMPANGFTYTGNASYGLGSTLPGATYFVAYSGPGSSVTLSNLAIDTTYNAAVFAYAGSGNATAYNHKPATASLILPPNQILAQVELQNGNVLLTFSANPGEWYWLQYSDSLNPASWQNVLPGPVLATNSLMTLVHPSGASAQQRYYRLQQLDPLFAVQLNSGALTALQRTGDSFPTDYIAGGRRLGDANIKYRQASDANWHVFQTASPSGVASAAYSTNGSQYIAHYQITNSLSGPLVFESVFDFQQNSVLWTLNATNLSGQSAVIGDFALPLPMNMAFSGVTSSTMKHSFVSGYGSFLFWMRPDSVGPYLLLTPFDNTKLEFWDDPGPPLGFEVYIHSLVAGTNAAAQCPAVTTQGSRWRQPNTSLTLSAGAAQSYGFK